MNKFMEELPTTEERIDTLGSLINQGNALFESIMDINHNLGNLRDMVGEITPTMQVSTREPYYFSSDPHMHLYFVEDEMYYDMSRECLAIPYIKPSFMQRNVHAIIWWAFATIISIFSAISGDNAFPYLISLSSPLWFIGFINFSRSLGRRYASPIGKLMASLDYSSVIGAANSNRILRDIHRTLEEYFTNKIKEFRTLQARLPKVDMYATQRDERQRVEEFFQNTFLQRDSTFPKTEAFRT